MNIPIRARLKATLRRHRVLIIGMGAMGMLTGLLLAVTTGDRFYSRVIIFETDGNCYPVSRYPQWVVEKAAQLSKEGTDSER